MTNDDAPKTRFVTVTEASRLLGQHPSAIRSRVRRRSIGFKKGNDNRLLIEVPADLDAPADNPPIGRDDAIDALRDENAVLRGQLDEERMCRFRAEAQLDATKTLLGEVRAMLDESRDALRTERERAARPWWRRLIGS